MWDFYDRTINELPDDLEAYIDFIHVGETWTVVSAGKYCGIAVTVNEQDAPVRDFSYLYGRPLKETAALCRSWDFMEASVGTAALNAYINSEDNVASKGCMATSNGFDDYKQVAAGKKVAIIGHFIKLERFLTESEVFVLERKPQPGDYPDSACEYLLPEMDLTIITGSAFINKTLPRLLQLSRHSVVLGPSTPMADTLLQFGADELSGYSPRSINKENAPEICSGNTRLSQYGERIRLL